MAWPGGRSYLVAVLENYQQADGSIRVPDVLKPYMVALRSSAKLKYLPLFHNLRGSRVLVVGGGEIALRKSRLLADAGALLRVVAPEIETQLRELVVASGGECLLRGYAEADLDSCVLIIAATDDETLNAQVSTDAHRRCVPVNVVDAPALCSVIFPAIVDRSPLIVAISSGGDAPVLARLIRAKIELDSFHLRPIGRSGGAFPQSGEKPVSGCAAASRVLGRRLSRPDCRSATGRPGTEAERLLQAKIDGEATITTGEVYLVGAGPGDPDLLTFKALRLMQQADVVLYDRLVAPAILELCRRDAERVHVGKRRADHAVPQDQINQQLVDLAKAGKRVVRLKGGDPFIFGRGGEEIEELAAHGIPFQVVPGITAASGCAAYAGIPLTHRDHAQSVRFVTGHLKDGSTDLRGPTLSRRRSAVFYRAWWACRSFASS